MRLSLPFASQVNFLDPQFNDDGTPYGPWRYKKIVEECYALSKNLNTSYTDILQITPMERMYLIQMLVDESNQLKEKLEKAKESGNK